jgi:uridine nucleosidase
LRFAFDKNGSPVRAIEGIAHHIRKTWNKGAGSKVTIVSTGPTTNTGMKTFLRCANKETLTSPFIALFVSIYPDLVDAVEQIIFMGGAMGLGNFTVVAGLWDPTS